MAEQSLINELVAIGGTPPDNPESVPDAVIQQMIADIRQQAQGATSNADAITAQIGQLTAPPIPPAPPPAPVPTVAAANQQKTFMASLLDQIAPRGTPPAIPVEMQSADQLAASTDPVAAGELARRKSQQSQPLVTQLANPDVLKQLSLGSAQLEDVPGWLSGLYGTVASPLEKVTGVNLGAKDALKYATENDTWLRNLLKVRAPETPVEGVINALPSVAVPIPGLQGTKLPGVLAKTAEAITPGIVGEYSAGKVVTNAAAQFAADQVIHEAEDSADSQYQTVFDSLGVPKQPAHDALNPWVLPAMGVMAATGLVAPAAIKVLQSRKMPAPVVREVGDLSLNAPENLQTIERAGDLYKTQLMDSKQALIDLAARAGVPNLDHINSLVDQNTQMSGLVRVNEGVNHGTINTQHGDFTSSIAPRALYDRYRAMPVDLQDDINKHLLLGDYTDDLRQQVNNPNGPANAAALLAQALADRTALEAKNPMIGQFAKDYRVVTDAVLNFMTQGPYAQVHPKGAQTIQTVRPNYVPLKLDGVDPTQNLAERLVDANAPSGSSVVDSFLLHRDPLAISGIDNRVPAIDALMDYTHAALKSKLYNEVWCADSESMMN